MRSRSAHAKRTGQAIRDARGRRSDSASPKLRQAPASTPAISPPSATIRSRSSSPAAAAAVETTRVREDERADALRRFCREANCRRATDRVADEDRRLDRERLEKSPQQLPVAALTRRLAI